ncbi:ATP synthase F0 subunit B [Myxococcota bacterium]|nr:ATP synthase F0 subunit B [Myxococcota bacterium]MBU1382558.1 ATP synthase F0 subunit B [Myxococcota bacterium]MBU1496085.1 ATP synthase F0 subunit B [Myxococcota bacterium]
MIFDFDGTIILHFLIFIATWLVVSRILVKSWTTLREKRHYVGRGAVEKAETLFEEAVELEAECENMIRTTRREAETMRASEREKAHKQADKIRMEADRQAVKAQKIADRNLKKEILEFHEFMDGRIDDYAEDLSDRVLER